MINPKIHARQLRRQQTVSEGLLWSVLRGRQLCGLKFRRQHPILNWIVDFACVEVKLIVEIDGGYHDQTQEYDLRREQDLKRQGWTVLRFTDEDVERDTDAIAHAIAAQIGLEYQFNPRLKTGAGIKSIRAKPPKHRPTPT